MPIQTYWQLSAEEALTVLHSGQQGLSDAEAQLRQQQYGSNVINERKKYTGLKLFLNQFKTPVTLLLILAAILSLTLGEMIDGIIILTIIFISSILGYWQEKGASNAVEELLKMIAVNCTVYREGIQQQKTIESLVPGDMIELSAGSLIPADCLLINSDNLFVDEATFTGETYPVEKSTAPLPADTPFAKRYNCVFLGSHVVSGKARALVIHTGRNTELGRLSGRLLHKRTDTEFERGIRRFGYMLMEITLILVLIIFAINVFLHKPVLDSFLFSLALAVGLTPQLLPVIVSINLARGATRMAHNKVIVKRLSAIPDFGSITVLCTDKTGTLTKGEVTVKDTLGSLGQHSEKTRLYSWLNASLQQGFHNPIDVALNNLYETAPGKYELLTEIPYDFIRKRLTVLISNEGAPVAITKGALLQIMAICSSAEMPDGSVIPIAECREQIMSAYEENSQLGYRVLGLAYKPYQAADSFSRDDEKEMIFLGMVTLYDPPKPDVIDTIQELQKLGVSLKLITGDNKLVAASLMKQIGYQDVVVLTGQQLGSMSNAALQQQVLEAQVFAEVEPNQKERIIQSLRQAGLTVGFMGDGINDAPALHAADVGISVNTAVDVAKEAASVILLAPQLNVLSNGIKEGRYAYANTMKYIFMATSANFGNMFSMAGASLFLSFLPLLPKQILLTNLMTDFPEMTIANDQVDEAALQHPTRFDLGFIRRFMIVFGLLSSVFDYLTFGMLIFLLQANETLFRTAWFTESVISACLIVLVIRTRKPFFRSRPGKSLLLTTLLVIAAVLLLPYILPAELMNFSPMPAIYLAGIGAIILFYVLCAELIKRWFYRQLAKPAKK
ncbi:MAG: magnesium-translocating P-type ATPase [Chitinophagaceae bacterium]